MNLTIFLKIIIDSERVVSGLFFFIIRQFLFVVIPGNIHVFMIMVVPIQISYFLQRLSKSSLPILELVNYEH